ncbi:type II toxin-antitoxin system VapC family toxin [Novosphingobium sp. G106]|uniref:type II toxin-antitoxin system VapC family toxin n=1 Tax=Novosphingobium sp. G106 TaxID=2849500 RepID=UPI001C2DAE6C|nr:type II toxin-antitoxin system VapC family toxin [Novosphingobium sp. G106]MBV1686428.1 type II toxin-antitoxin system VapC family toxin [Novosphingobium sp. G106]
MFIDASALTAILADEKDGPELLARMDKSRIRITSPLATWETTVAVARILGLSIKDAEQAVEEFLALAAIRVVAVDPSVRALAIEAFDRYGKSRHPAALNFGDCFAYACARHAGLPLLYKGDDFPQTDIETA